MSDFAFLNAHRERSGPYGSSDWARFNGMFFFWHRGQHVRVLASDGGGWQHVSVSLVEHPATPPKWEVMCAVKDLFWEPEDCVVQFHPPALHFRRPETNPNHQSMTTQHPTTLRQRRQKLLQACRLSYNLRKGLGRRKARSRRPSRKS